MGIYEEVSNFYNKTVKDYEKLGDITDFTQQAPRIRIDWDHTTEEYEERLITLLTEAGASSMEALVLGAWHGEESENPIDPIIQLLVSSKAKAPNLKALFVGDITVEENEISWIVQGDLSSLWSAFPNLEVAYARGGQGLRLGRINSPTLKKLVIQTGGMPAPVVREALEANAPLEHLELWLGDENYGATSSVGSFSELLAGNLFPNLKYLGLSNCEYADDLAEAIAQSEIINRIETLDISKGTLSDRGANALLNSGKLPNLKKLDIHHHYVSPEVVTKLKAAVSELNAEDPQELDDYGPYVSVSE